MAGEGRGVLDQARLRPVTAPAVTADATATFRSISGAFLDGMDLVGHQTVRLTVDRRGRSGVGSSTRQKTFPSDSLTQ